MLPPPCLPSSGPALSIVFLLLLPHISPHLLLLPVCSPGPVIVCGYNPNTQTHSSPCKFNLSTLTSEVIKLAKKCMNSTFLNDSSLWARKGETVSMVKLFQTNSEKKKNTTWSKNIIILAKQGFSFATVLTGKDCTALLPSWCQWCCWLSPFGKCQFGRAMGRVSTVEGGGFSWRI